MKHRQICPGLELGSLSPFSCIITIKYIIEKIQSKEEEEENGEKRKKMKKEWGLEKERKERGGS